MFIGDEFVMVEIFEVHSGSGGVEKKMQSYKSLKVCQTFI
jgi:hypothetical protein